MKSNISIFFILILGSLLLSSGFIYAQNPISGIIKRTNGAPVPHATVSIRGTNTSVSADEEGVFNILSRQEPPFFLQVSSVGYKAQDFQVLQIQVAPLELVLLESSLLDEIVVTSRRRSEALQEVPIPVSVIGGSQIEQSGAFNVNRVKELIPSVQLYTSNPRNTGINIRGIGSPFGLTNDGLDPGVGFYVDGVYYARPAAATIDFIDVERIEVLRGPQGTLFGKNTSAGAFNIITRKASFIPETTFETSFGNYGYIQAKASLSGPLSNKFAARLSFSGTQRDGLIENVRTGSSVNDINNLGLRAQLLYRYSENLSVTLASDFTDQKPDGYAQVVAGVAPTLRPAYRQFDAITADLAYSLPSLNAFDRKIDHDTPWRSGNQLGGVSLNVDAKVGFGTLTSTSAWRYWNWDPSNDRDFTGLQALSKSQNPSKHRNWSQEVRYAGELSSNLSGVLGVFYMDQEVKTTGTEESGSDQARFSKNSTGPNANTPGISNDELWATPGLLEGYGIYTNASIRSQSAAVFASLDYELVDGFHVLPGIRVNYDKKDMSYDRVARGGLDVSGASAVEKELHKIKNSVYSSQQYKADADETNFTYQLTMAYKPSRRLNAFATYSTSYKPVGVNVAGLPSVNGQVATELAVIKPEATKHYELGLKTMPTDNLTLNLTLHNSDIKDYQTNVQSAELGVNRGYLANAEKVNVRGIELDASIKANEYFSFYGAAAYTDAKYVRFSNAPLPLEETGLTVDGVQVSFKDISGGVLPGVSKWAGSIGGEFSIAAKSVGKDVKFFIALDDSFRSSFSSSSSPSAYLNIDSYTVLNARTGFKAPYGLSGYIWSRNLLDKNYFEQLLPAGGNAGHYAGVLGDQRTFGITLRYGF